MQLKQILNNYYDSNINSEQTLIENLKDFRNKGGDISSPIEESQFLIHFAADNGLLILIRWLVANGTNIEERDSEGNTPLLVAIDSDIDGAIQSNDILSFSTTLLLLSFNANINAKNFNNEGILDVVNSYGGKTIKEKFNGLVLKRVSCPNVQT